MHSIYLLNKSEKKLEKIENIQKIKSSEKTKFKITQIMGACHNVLKIGNSNDLFGESLEINMLK